MQVQKKLCLNLYRRNVNLLEGLHERSPDTNVIFENIQF